MLTDVVSLASRLVRFDTANPPGGEAACLEYLAGGLAEAGFAVHLDSFGPGRVSLVARLHPDAPQSGLCLAGHIDTVPLGRAEWRVDPLAGEVRNGRLHGRGASDMKGGIAAMVAAAVSLAPRLPADRDLVLCIFGGEESGCAGSFHVAAQPELLGDLGAAVIAEPTSNRPLVGHKGALWLKGEARGRTAHGSMPELGDNALYKALEAADRLRRYDFDGARHAHLGPPTLSVNTFAAGQNVNSVPDLASFSLDVRTVAGQDNAAVAAALSRLAGPDIAFSELLNLPPVWTPPDHPWLARVFTLLAETVAPPPGVETVQFFTDAAALRAYHPDLPMVILGPGDPGQAHRTDEYCETGALTLAVVQYGRIIADWFGKGELLRNV